MIRDHIPVERHGYPWGLFIHSDTGQVIGLIVGCITYIISGYVTGRLAKKDTRINAILVGILNIISVAVFWGSSDPFWANAIPIIVAVPLTVWGVQIAQQKNEPAYYTGWQAFFASFLGGPLAGCWLVACNYQLFGEKNKARWTMIGGLVFSIVLFVTIWIFGISSYFMSFSYIGIPVYFRSSVDLVQKQQLAKVITAGIKKQSHWRMIGIGLVSFIPMLFLLIGVDIILAILHVPENAMWKPLASTVSTSTPIVK